MKQTLEMANEYQKIAADFDARLVENRAPYIARGYSEVTGTRRKPRYIGRLAGIYDEPYHHAQTVRYLNWFVANAAEKPEFAEKFKAFWFPVFEYAEKFRDFYPRHRRNLKEIQQEKTISDFRLQCAIAEGDLFEIANALYKQNSLIEEMSEACGLMQPNGNGKQNGKVEIFA